MKRSQNKFQNLSLLIAVFAAAFLFMASCSSNSSEQKENTSNKSGAQAEAEEAPEIGVGPVKTVQLQDELDQGLVDKGLSIFESKCSACHQFEDRYVGPALGGITERRNHVWIMNMIVNPEEMTKKDPIAKQLMADYLTQMVNQNVTEEDDRAILEYFRSVDKAL